MAADNVTILMLYIRIANLLISAYIVKELISVAFFHKGAFSKTMKIMLLAVLVFFGVELVQVFRIMTGPEADLIQSAFLFSFLLLLLSTLIEMKKGARAHEHLVRHRHRGRLSDVE
ncbi:TPA: hypothetical protein HA225_01615 [Candidatus Micrarchaeota archaeon]|nr:hypothetical protein [Candidatus Micrarchaeota archaeon]HIH30039.1 hypothetical protein [Candidatus Micrarchaeota archaeon]